MGPSAAAEAAAAGAGALTVRSDCAATVPVLGNATGAAAGGAAWLLPVHCVTVRMSLAVACSGSYITGHAMHRITCTSGLAVQAACRQPDQHRFITGNILASTVQRWVRTESRVAG